MTSLPDFSPYGYQIIEQLNQNLQGGRITYKAIALKDNNPVIIKQFRFATSSDWNSYKEIEREISILQDLNHDGIPKYLAKFDPNNGLCLVQEYKEAQPLSKLRTFSPEEIKSIAVQLLKILVYLQQERIPSIFHRDIKPENVLVDNQNKVYLIDFGLARIGNKTMALSSLMGGTLGFMSPEQVQNQSLTKASDLYGLGATLICLITQTKSKDIGSLVDFSTNKITFKDKVPEFSIKFIKWLEKVVEPNPLNRYEDAESALRALYPLHVIRTPEIRLNKLMFNFVADFVGEKLSQPIQIKNFVPETVLEGEWSVSPHKNDPPHTPDNHSWISFSPQQFKGNKVNCVVTVDTSKLKLGANYQRSLILSTNTKDEDYSLKLKVKTASTSINTSIVSYWLIAFSGLILAIASGFSFYYFSWKLYYGTTRITINADLWILLGIFIWAVIGAIGNIFYKIINKTNTDIVIPSILGYFYGQVIGSSFGSAYSHQGSGYVVGTIYGALVGVGLGLIAGIIGKEKLENKNNVVSAGVYGGTIWMVLWIVIIITLYLFYGEINTVSEIITGANRGVIVVSILGVIAGAFYGQKEKGGDINIAIWAILGAIVGANIGAIFGAIFALILRAILSINAAIIISGVFGATFAAIFGIIFGAVYGKTHEKIKKPLEKTLKKYFSSQKFNQKFIFSYIFLSCITGLLIVIGIIAGFNSLLWLVSSIYALTLIGVLIYPISKSKTSKAKSQSKQKVDLIEP